MLDRFTERARRVVDFAWHHAGDRGPIDIGDLRAGVVLEMRSASRQLLMQGNEPDRASAELDGYRTNGPTLREIRFTSDAARVIELAGVEAHRAGDAAISPEHIAQGLICAEAGVAAEPLARVPSDGPSPRHDADRRGLIRWMPTILAVVAIFFYAVPTKLALQVESPRYTAAEGAAVR